MKKVEKHILRREINKRILLRTTMVKHSGSSFFVAENMV